MSTQPPASSLAILIPAYNEAERIALTITAARSAVAGRIIVVDDGSEDATAEAARQAGADDVVHLYRNQGKGAALNSGLALTSAPLILLLDADLGDSAALVAPLVEAVACGECDMAVAAFPRTGKKSGFGFAQGFARWGIQKLSGRTFDSPISGQRCVRHEMLDRLGGFAEGFGVEVALTLGVLAQGGTVREVELRLSHRKTGRTLAGFRHRASQALAIFRALLRARLFQRYS